MKQLYSIQKNGHYRSSNLYQTTAFELLTHEKRGNRMDSQTPFLEHELVLGLT